MGKNGLISIGKELLAGVNKSFGAPDLGSPGRWDHTEQLTTDAYRSSSTMWFFGANGVDYPFSYSGLSSSLRAYCDCPPLAAVINKKAKAYNNGKVFIMNSRENEAFSAPAQRLRKLFTKPNPLQNWRMFEAQNYVYRQLFGYAIVLCIKPVGFDENIDTEAMWNIPPFLLDIEETDKMFWQQDISGIIKKITLRYKGYQTNIPIKDVFIMRDYTPAYDSLLFPGSRIEAIRVPVTNVMEAYESRQQIMRFRGVRGVFTREVDPLGSMPVTQKERDEINNGFQRYGLLRGQYQFIITSAALKYQEVGQKTKDLMLIEEVMDDIERICDAYDYPYRLLSQQKSASYNDVSEFKKLLYQDAIVPESESDFEQWNEFFDTPKYNLKIEKDFSHVAVLQEDEKKKAETRKVRNDALEKEWRNGKLTLNQWCVMNGEDKLTADDGRGDLYFPEYVALYGDPQKGITPSDNESPTTDDNEK